MLIEVIIFIIAKKIIEVFNRLIQEQAYRITSKVESSMKLNLRKDQASLM